MDSAIYYNPSYLEFGPTYAVYARNAGLFKLDMYGNCRIMPTAITDFGEDMKEEILDSYMESRQFSKVLTLSGGHITWEDEFKDKRVAISSEVTPMIDSIVRDIRYSLFNYKMIHKGFGVLAHLKNKLSKVK